MSPICLQLILDLLPDFVPVAGSHTATLMIFLETISQRPKGQRLLWMPRSSSTTVLRKSVTRCCNCQGLQSSAMSFVQQSLATKELGSIWRTLLDRRLLDCEFDRPSCITYQDFPSLPKISVQSASRKSYRARRSTNFNQSSTLGLTILKRKKGNHCESHKNDRNIMPSWLDSAPRLETFHIEARWSRKEKKETCQTKRKLEKQKEQGAGKESEGRRNNKLKKKEINGIQNRI